ncbi:MAG TPA: hypothetical protein VGW34_04140 [Allosphingosinicella sp.]|nr:hypothetical protein [Allosphingosinicella sp.]
MRDGTGKHRTRGADGAPDTVWVVDRSISFDIGERLYRDRGYSPPFEQLPWKGEPAGYDAPDR